MTKTVARPPRKPKPADRRAALLDCLQTMPDEAFGWFVAWAAGAMMQFPDGLGGFSPGSQTSIRALRAAGEAYIKTL